MCKNKKQLVSACNTANRKFLYVIYLKIMAVLVQHSRKQYYFGGVYTRPCKDTFVSNFCRTMAFNRIGVSAVMERRVWTPRIRVL